MFKLPVFKAPNFNDEKYNVMENVKTQKAQMDGVAPQEFYITTHMPTYYKVNNKWILPKNNCINCVAVVKENDVVITEFRDIKKGDEVILGNSRDGKQGILLYKEGFPDEVYQQKGNSVESSFSQDYKNLFELMQYEKENEGYIVWVLGPSVVFDYDTRNALNRLAENGYINCLLGGNAMCTHDLEGGFLNTALGQNIYTQENVPMGHYNHLDLLNEVRTTGSIKQFIADGNVKDGIIKTLNDMQVPFVLCGSIRDDGPLPEVYANTDEGLTATKKELDKATLIITVATMLHSASVASMASGYRYRKDGSITPVYMYTVDITENVVNKIAASRENMAFTPLITNAQDFVVNCEKALIQIADKEFESEIKIEEKQYVQGKNQINEGGIE